MADRSFDSREAWVGAADGLCGPHPWWGFRPRCNYGRFT
jgi:hypothetical protein